VRTIAKEFVIRRMARKLHILKSNTNHIASIAKLFADAVLKGNVEERLSAPGSILMGLPLDAHALLMSAGPFDLEIRLEIFCEELLLRVLIIGVAKSPDACQDESAFVAFLGPFGLENALFQDLNRFIRPTDAVQSTTLVKQVSRGAVAIINVLLQEVELSLKLGRFVAPRILLEDLLWSQEDDIVGRALPLLVTSVFADPVAIHTNNSKTVLLRKRQAMCVMQTLGLLFEHLLKSFESHILQRHLGKFALGRILLVNHFRIRIEEDGLCIIQRPLERVLYPILRLLLGFRASFSKVDESGRSHFAGNSREILIDNLANHINRVVSRTRVQNVDALHELCDTQEIALEIGRLILHNHIQDAFRHLITIFMFKNHWPTHLFHKSSMSSSNDARDGKKV
jgi:hypothetical protein